MPSAYRAAALARAHNDWLRDHYLDQDPRLRGAIVCPAQDSQAAAEEIRRCAEDKRFVHVLLVGGSERPYGEPRYLPIFEAAAECGLPVAIHSGGEGIGIAASPGGAGCPTFYIEWHTQAVAGSIMAHLVSLLCHGVFERFPNLRVLLMEGAWPGFPACSGASTPIGALCASRCPGSSASRAKSPVSTSRSRRSLWSTPTGTTRCSSRCSRRSVLPTSSASPPTTPNWDFDDPEYMLRRLPDSWRDQVIHGNAASLYRDRLGLVAA